MNQVLNRVRDVDPNDSDAIKEALTAFFQNLPKHKNIDCSRWLPALENVINRFPKYCGQHRATIEHYLSHFLDSNNYYNVIEAAKCAHAVQQVRAQQERTALAESCWRNQMSLLCEAAHSLIGALFANSGRIFNKNGNTQKSNAQFISPLQEALRNVDTVKPQDITNKSDILCTRLRNVLVFIQAMLVEIYPVAKPIRPQLVLEVILQALSTSRNEDSTKVTTVKVQALRTLDAIVACLGSNLIPFSALVIRFVMQTLRWSSENSCEESRTVRCAAYNTLTKWLNTLHVHRESSDDRASSFENELTSHIISDVIPPKHVIQLTPNAQPMKNLSKKARKKLANSLLMQSSITSHMPGEKNKINVTKESNDEVANAALECVEAFLTSCGIFLKPTTHKQFQEVFVRECFNIDNYSSERGLWLLRALEACRKSCSPKVPPPTQYCLQLYSALLNNSEPEIAKFSSQILLDIRLHLHCAPPSLNFALEVQPESNNREDKRKRVSERNRNALENLLGQESLHERNYVVNLHGGMLDVLVQESCDGNEVTVTGTDGIVPPDAYHSPWMSRMTSENLAVEEIITIPDEPLSKRLRLDENVSDKISLSSESAVSVRTTDGSSVEEVEDEADLEDSIDYIIGPIVAEIEKSVGFPQKTKEYNKEVIAADLIEQIDETDGQDVNVEDADVIEQSDTSNEEVNDNVKNVADEDTLQDAETNTQKEFSVFEAKTQLPVSMVNFLVDSENRSPSRSPSSFVEVAYDYPNTGQEKVTVLEKMDEDNLPSTNDTDDVQITCGQTVNSSQDVIEVKEPETNEAPKENGIAKSPERLVENGDATSAEIEDSVSSKIVSNTGEVSVEDMLADFVDEVNDESPQLQA